MAEKNELPLTYKGLPLVRCGKEIYLGSMADPYVAYFRIQSEDSFGDMMLSGRVTVQILNTDPEVSIKERVVKKTEKEGLYNALDIGSIWLKRELKNHTG